MPSLAGEQPQWLSFLVELGKDISSGDGEFGVQISEVGEQSANVE